MLAAKEGRIFNVCDRDVPALLSGESPKVIIATSSAGRFVGFVDVLSRNRKEGEIFLQVSSPISKDEPRIKPGISIPDHMKANVTWKILAVADRLGGLLNNELVVVYSGDCVKTDGKKIFEKPKSVDEAHDQARSLVGVDHSILNAIARVYLDPDGVSGRLDVDVSLVETPVFFDLRGRKMEDFVGLVPGAFDFLNKSTLFNSRIGVDVVEGRVIPDVRNYLEHRDINWKPGSVLLLDHDKNRMIRQMVYAPQKAILMLARR